MLGPAGSATYMSRCGIPGDLPKYAPAMRRAITTTRSWLRSWKVVQIDNQLPNARQSL